MEVLEACPLKLGQGNLDLVVRSSSGGASTCAPTSIEPQGFEWIAHGDASARKRARSHVTRGFRRQKAVLAGAQKSKKEPKKARGQSTSSTESDEEINLVTITSEKSNAALVNIPISRKYAGPAIHNVGNSKSDPFAAFPVKLSPETHALLDHFFFGLAPLSFAGDSHSDFQPVKKLVFNMGLQDAPAFHLILSASACDIASLQGKEEPKTAIEHHRIAINLLSQRLLPSSSDSTICNDASIAAVGFLAGYELLFGDPCKFNTHLKGLETLLNLRGGIEMVRETSPQLFSIAQWFDYAGACNLFSKRIFPTVTHDLRLPYTTPAGVAEIILKGLPIGYDLYGVMFNTFDEMRVMTVLVRSCASIEDRIFKTELDLYKSLCAPQRARSKSRRQHIQQVFHILTLIYVTLILRYEAPATEIFLYWFGKLLTGDMNRWTLAVSNLYRIILASEDFGSDLFNAAISELVDISITLEWTPWKTIKEVLLDFFVGDPACQGPLQEKWKIRIAALTRPQEGTV